MPYLNVPKENWIMYLLGLLQQIMNLETLLEFVNIVSRETNPVSIDYDHIKNLLLKCF